MKIAVCSLTKNGEALAQKISCFFEADIFKKEDYKKGFLVFIQEIFIDYDAFIFIMATGIAVRAIAPVLKHKTIDPAVVVLDEKGQFAISLLSGHLGGANDLTKKIAQSIGSSAVITTATDCNEKVSFDIVAKKNNCVIKNINLLKYISSAVVNGEKIGLFCDYEIIAPLFEYISFQKEQKNNVFITNHFPNLSQNNYNLILIPVNIVIGIGCKKGKTKEEIKSAVYDFLNQNHIYFNAVKCIASIDLKKEEKGIVEFCKEKKLPFITLPKEKLEKVEQEFECSDFVKQTIGVGNVAEACAVHAFENTKLICKKTIYSGITLALGEIQTKIIFD